jgi:hypothetical protein
MAKSKSAMKGASSKKKKSKAPVNKKVVAKKKY